MIKLSDSELNKLSKEKLHAFLLQLKLEKDWYLNLSADKDGNLIDDTYETYVKRYKERFYNEEPETSEETYNIMRELHYYVQKIEKMLKKM